MFEVVYYAVCGNNKSICQNTKGLAEVIAAELGVREEDITAKKGLAKDTFVFLGWSCYGDKPGGKLSEFIEENDFKGRQVALFGTSLIGKSGKLKRVEELLKPTGALIRGNFCCERKALPLLHRGRPSKKELTNAKEFANEMKKP
jgi:flavodoxin